MRIQENQIIDIIFFGVAVFFAIGMFLLLMLRTFNKRQLRFKLERQLSEAKHEETLLKSQLEIQEQTMRTISEEIHDNVIQLLSLSKLKMNSILLGKEESVTEVVTQTKQILSDAIQYLRSLSHNMNGEFILSKGLHQSIQSIFNSLGNSAGIRFSVSQTGEAYDLGGNREIVLFRIFQEALNNCLKHSNASAFSVELTYQPDAFAMKLSDNGKGFDINNPAMKGVGLKNIENRTKLINVGFEMYSLPMGGTSILLTAHRL